MFPCVEDDEGKFRKNKFRFTRCIPMTISIIYILSNATIKTWNRRIMWMTENGQNKKCFFGINRLWIFRMNNCKKQLPGHMDSVKSDPNQNYSSRISESLCSITSNNQSCFFTKKSLYYKNCPTLSSLMNHCNWQHQILNIISTPPKQHTPQQQTAMILVSLESIHSAPL